MRKFLKGLKALMNKQIDMDTDTIKTILLDLTQSDVGVKQITGATNASPPVITATAHGWSNGDIVWTRGIGGNQSCNGLFKIANVAANTFELQRLDGTNASGSAAYTSGGSAINLTIADFVDDISACRIGTDQALTTKTLLDNVFDADDATWPSSDFATQKTFHGFAIYRDSGAEGTSELVYFGCGRQLVIAAADAASSATTLWVEPLAGPIPSGTQIWFTNGQSATLSGAAAAGARSLSVNALASAIAAGNHGDAPTTGSGFPWTIQNAPFLLQWDAGANRIFAL